MADNPKPSGGGLGIVGNLIASALAGGGASIGVKYLGPLLGWSLDSSDWTTIASIIFAAIFALVFVIARYGRAAYRAIHQRLNRASATGTKLAIVIAALKDDNSGRTQHVEESLRQQFGASVEIIRRPEDIALGEHGNRDERERKAEETGRDILKSAKGDVLVWGTAFPATNIVELRFLARDADRGGSETHRYALNEALLLPEDFGTELGAAVAAVAVLAAAPAFDGGHYVVDLLRPAVRRLRHLVDAPPPSLTGDAKARIFFSYAIACQTIGQQAGEAAYLVQAVSAYRDALKEWTREKIPLQWATTQNNLGTTLSALGARDSGTARLEEAVSAFREALRERTRERVPLDWAGTQSNLGTALQALGERGIGTARLVEAVAAFREALKEHTSERAPLERARTQTNLGAALHALGAREEGTARMQEAVVVFREALEERTRTHAPLQWATTQNNLANVLTTLGERESSAARLEEAVAIYREVLKEWTREQAPLQWAITQNNLGSALNALGKLEGETARLEEAVAAYQEALKVFTEAGASHYVEVVTRNLARTEKLLAERSKK